MKQKTMNTTIYRKEDQSVLNDEATIEPTSTNNEKTNAFAELKRGVHTALETYSNVHRGSGHYSMVTTTLIDQSRNIVLEYLGLKPDKYLVIFCTSRRAVKLTAQLSTGSYYSVSSRDIGLSLGVTTVAVKKKSFPRNIVFETGGGTARLISPGWVIWAKGPGRFEAGTPAIINIIAFAKALQLIHNIEDGNFRQTDVEIRTAFEILYNDELEKLSGQELLGELRKTLIGSTIYVPTSEGMKSYINLDNAASTPTFTPIWKSVYQTWQQPLKIQHEIVREVRSICARVLGAPLSDYDIVFTSNTTEAINLAAESLSGESTPAIEPVVLNTYLEHNSNELPWRSLPGLSLLRLQVDSEGFIDLQEMEKQLYAYNRHKAHGNKRIVLVAVSGASNVLGTFNDLAAISQIVHRYGARLLVDAAQLTAHRKVSMNESGIDYLAFSAHKMYAPFGSGALVVRKGLLQFDPEEMELITSSGEENAGGIAALGKAFLLLERIGIDRIQAEEQALTGILLRRLAQIPGIKIFGIRDTNSPRFVQKGGVIVFSMGNIMPNQIARKLAEKGGIGVRAGCHCAHILIKHILSVSPFLQQFQYLIITLFPQLELPGLLRVSTGIQNNEKEVDRLIQVLTSFTEKPEIKVGGYQTSSSDGKTFSQQKAIRKPISDYVRNSVAKIFNTHVSMFADMNNTEKDLQQKFHTNAIEISDNRYVSVKYKKTAPE
jgi:selenocysteine lyase/cysteine desulfurase